MSRTVVVFLIFSMMIAANASAGLSLERILKKGAFVVCTNCSQPPMTAINIKVV